ncbi:helix-turn-helix domain-containing protein [Streptomycetaceae bacterium NBC_01309]
MSDANGPDTTAQDEVEPLSFGRRLKIERERKHLSRAALGGLLGKSEGWVKGLEVGRLAQPKLPVLLRIAEVLRIRDLATLTGDQSINVELFCGPGHDRLPAVRRALNLFPMLPDLDAPSHANLRTRLNYAWSARHSAPDHREVIGRLLPDLIRDAQLAVRQAAAATDRRAAHALLSEAYSLTQFFVAYQPAQDLLWRVAERGMAAAQESEDAHAIGIAGWLTVQAHRDAGDWEAADEVNRGVLSYLEPRLPDAPDDVLAIWGALTYEVGYTAARRADTPTAWRYWDQAQRVAHRLPAAYYHPVTSFSHAIMGAHAVTVAVELHAGGESVRQAARAEASVIPSRPRRARHRVEQARAYHLDGQPEVAVATLDAAYEAAPDTVAWNGYARRILLEELDSPIAARRGRAAVTAERIGLLAT